jgi:hypothetical protein
MFLNFFSRINLPNKQKNKSTILKYIYNDLNESDKIIDEKIINNNAYVFSTHRSINNPKLFESIPKPILKKIKNNIYIFLRYTLNIFNRNVQITFATKDKITRKNVEKYNNYIFLMSLWLHIASKYSTHNCSSTLNIYIYLTNDLKQLPINGPIGPVHANTAFTQLCDEIIIFREEEWFKVFIHESIHNFNLDFAEMNQQFCNEKIKNIYNVKSNINLYEAYTEFFARLMNSCVISFINTNNSNDFLKLTHQIMDNEIKYSCFQMVKVLDYMDLTYDDLLNSNGKKYRENTNILSYFIICNVLMYNYSDLLQWCYINNTNLYNFKKTTVGLSQFCNFIRQNYNNPNLVQNIRLVKNIYNNLKKTNGNSFLLNNLQMTMYKI